MTAQTITVNSLSGGKTSSYMAVHFPADVNVFACVCIDYEPARPKDPAILKYCLDKLDGDFTEMTNPPGNIWYADHYKASVLTLENAKMWLGWELGRIRESSKGQDKIVTDTELGFDWAINALKNRKKVRRSGWNGKGMYLWLLPATEVKKEWVKDPMLLSVFGDRDVLPCLGSIRMKTATGEVLTGWLASQTDMLATDWELAE